MSTPEKWLDAEGLRYALHGEDNESVLDSDSGIIINAGHQEDAELLRDQLNSYESRLAEQKAAALSLRDELAALRVESQEGAEIVGELKAELAEWKDKLGAMTAAHRYATDELAECRAKLAAQIERCGFAELAETQRALERDNALAKLAQAESETARVRAMLDEDEALRDAVRENLPECTCDADGNLGGEVDRVEFAGEELRRALAKLAQAEQERNRYAAQTVTLGVAHQMAETDLAAAQAESVRLREALESVFRSHPWLGDEPDMVPARRVALSTPRGSRAALREMLAECATDAVDRYIEDGCTASAAAEAAVSRLLPEEGGQS